MNDTMGPEGLVPFLLVFGAIPTSSVINRTLLNQHNRMAALQAAKTKLVTITAKLQLSQTVRSKLPSDKKNSIIQETTLWFTNEKKNCVDL